MCVHQFIFLTILLGLPGCLNGCVLWWGGRAPLPLFVFSPGCLRTLCHVVCGFQSVDTNGQQVSTKQPLYPIMYSLYSCKVLTHALSLFSVFVCCALLLSLRDREYDDIDEEDPFNPQARRMSYNPRRSNIHSFCSYTSSLGSQASLHPPPQSASNVVPPPEYM